MANTPILGFPLISQNQSQKHVTANATFRDLDVLIQLSVLQRGINAPPGSPVEGDRYIVGTAPTGLWAGKPNRVVAFIDGLWRFYMPVRGWVSYVQSDGSSVTWNGTDWIGMAAVTAAQLNDGTLPASFTTLAASGDVTLQSSKNVLFVGSSANTPTFSTRSVGTRVVLFPAVTASAVDYALGIASNNFWMSIPTAGPQRFSWYGGTTELMTLLGTGALRTTLLGLGGATADATNRFSINTPGVLFNHAGAGINASFNKNAVANDASFTFQTAFSSRALLGLLADDNFSIKVSPNGTAFFTGLNIRANDGHVGVGGATADANNGLSVFGNALFNRDSTNSISITLNKTAAANDASFTFQSGFSTRALFGLLASDSFTIKVSPNGSSFFDGVIFDAATGKAQFPNMLQLVGQNGDPSSPVNGDIWYSFASNRLKARIDGSNAILGLAEVPYVVPPSGAYIRSATTPSAVTTTVAGVANRILLHPFIPKYDFTSSGIAINVTTAVASSLAKLVVYSSDILGRPDQRLTESGDLDCAAVGAKEAAISVDFKEGKQYWIGVRTSSTQTLSAHQAYCSPDIDSASVIVSPSKTFARTLAFATASPQSWGYNAAERSTVLAPCVWFKIT